MGMESKKANNYGEAKRLLDLYGDFHDCSIVCLVQDFSAKRAEIHLDSVSCGLEHPSTRPGALVLEQIEYLVFRIPFVGGEVRIEGVELSEANEGFIVKFDVTTTEWTDSKDFAEIKAEVHARHMCVKINR